MAKAKKRTDGRYQRSVVIGHKNGKPLRKTVYAKTLKELDEKCHAVRKDLDTGLNLIDDRISVADLFDRYYQKDVVRRVSPKTAASYRRTLAAIKDAFGALPAKKLTIGMVEDFKSSREGHPEALFKMLTQLRAALDYGMRHDILARNVARLVPMPVLNPPRKRALTAREKHLIEAAKLPTEERAFISILYNTGVRRGEALALTTADINVHRRRVTINKSMAGPPKTKAGFRIITVPAKMMQEVTPLIRLRENQGQKLLFPNAVGHLKSNPQFVAFWDGIKRGIFGSVEAAPKDFTPHLFRHNYASELCVAGVPIKSAQYLLGHADVATTLNIYTHFGWLDVDITPLERWREKQKIAADF